MKTELILASASPRRIELLRMLNLFDVKVIPAQNEDPYPQEFTPFEAVQKIAASKAKAVAGTLQGSPLILAADTVVALENTVLGKPKDQEDAFRMLRSLSGKKHSVYTGMALVQGERVLCDTAKADVRFRDISDEEILAYIATGSPLDKAGAYGAQDMAALFVEQIVGEFYTVVGLPICKLGELFRNFGVKLI